MTAPFGAPFGVLGLPLKVNPFIWTSGTVGSTDMSPAVTMTCIIGAGGVEMNATRHPK